MIILYYDINPTENDTGIFVIFFSGVMHPVSKLTSVASLEHNWCFFRTQPSDLWNTTVTSH